MDDSPTGGRIKFHFLRPKVKPVSQGRESSHERALVRLWKHVIIIENKIFVFLLYLV